MKLVNISFFALMLVLLVLGAFLAGYLFHERLVGADNFPLLDEAYHLVKDHGLNPPPPDPAMEYGMIRGMLQAYGDPHTAFFEPAQHELQSNALEGKYGGIGVQLEKDSQGYWVLFPFPESPARQAGIQDGDRLLAVEALKISPDTPVDSIQSAVRGPVGQNVKLTIGHAPGYAPVVLTLKREEIPLPSVTWRLDMGQPDVGVIKVNLIAASSAEEIRHAVKDLTERGASRFVLDLRDNPGGLLTAGVDIARLFLKEGVVMQQQYRDQDVQTYRVEKAGPLASIPLAVLINEGSASAAEIAAGALQAQHRAPLIGTKSYGKDTIQLVFSLKDDSSLHVTSAHWWLPGQKSIGGIGLQPDVPVDPTQATAGADPILQAAVQYLLSQP